MRSTPKRTSNSVWNPRVLGYQKYKLDRPLTQALAELPTSGFLANASSTTTRSMRFMSGRADHSGVGAWSNTPRWPLNSIDVFDATILRPWQPLPAGL